MQCKNSLTTVMCTLIATLRMTSLTESYCNDVLMILKYKLLIIDLITQNSNLKCSLVPFIVRRYPLYDFITKK